MQVNVVNFLKLGKDLELLSILDHKLALNDSLLVVSNTVRRFGRPFADQMETIYGPLDVQSDHATTFRHIQEQTMNAEAFIREVEVFRPTLILTFYTDV